MKITQEIKKFTSQLTKTIKRKFFIIKNMMSNLLEDTFPFTGIPFGLTKIQLQRCRFSYKIEDGQIKIFATLGEQTFPIQIDSNLIAALSMHQGLRDTITNASSEFNEIRSHYFDSMKTHNPINEDQPQSQEGSGFTP